MDDTKEIFAVQFLEMYNAINRVKYLHRPCLIRNADDTLITVCCVNCYEKDDSAGEKIREPYPCSTIKSLYNH